MIDTADLLTVFQKYRGESIVVSGRSSRHWVNISTNEKRDVPLGDPAMGGHASFAFGLAMANPNETIILFDSEGDLIMNMGVFKFIRWSWTCIEGDSKQNVTSPCQNIHKTYRLSPVSLSFCSS